MLFNSWIYICFLFLTVALYWLIPKRFKVLFILITSYVFYMSWSPPFGLIYGPVIFLDSLYFYWLSRAMVKWPEFKKKILIFGITSELCLLGYFKYADFLFSTVDTLMSLMHLPAFHIEFNVFLPLAISFTNFILISYLVDIYRGAEKPDHSFTRFAAYVAFFPHLIAGPIVRAKELLHQFDQMPAFNLQLFTRGIHLFLYGIFIKIFVADLVAPYVEMIYTNQSLQGFDTSWVATYCFAIQIFCDFAGYTLMAQGSAQLLGYKLPENFDAPYFSANITDFWRRWHMSLSRWLKDYLYIPLGGSRCSRFRTYLNLFITMGLGGLWHGASWNFVIWGLCHGFLLSAHKFADYFRLARWIPYWLAIAITFHSVCLVWVFFRAKTFESAWHMVNIMMSPLTLVGLSPQGKLSFIIVILFFIGHALKRYFTARATHFPLVDWVQGLSYAVLIYLVITLKVPSQQFIYFQF
jgi:alginate O-acetyltransferase complex protein AlgI